MTEQWRAIPGYEGRYEVSDMGRVKSVIKSSNHHIRSLATDRDGYKMLPIAKMKNGKTVDENIVALIAIIDKARASMNHALRLINCANCL